MIALGRRVRPTSRMPRSAAWDSRKRKSIDCAFSEFRAMLKLYSSYRMELLHKNQRMISSSLKLLDAKS